MNQFLVIAAAEKIAAMETERFFEERRKRDISPTADVMGTPARFGMTTVRLGCRVGSLRSRNHYATTTRNYYATTNRYTGRRF